jgi:hypothetical protein
MRAPGAPAYRPSWFVLLSALMLAYGGMLLVWGLTAFRDPQATGRLPIADTLPPAEETFLQQLAALNKTVIAAHAPAIRARAAAALVLSLLMLYAAAAALARDRHGRAAALGAAWLGIAYQIGTLPLAIPMAREYARASAPLLAQMVKAQQDGGVPVDATPESIASMLQSLLVGLPVVMAVLGVAGSVLLIRYFGGRRGRALYGLLPDRGNR